MNRSILEDICSGGFSFKYLAGCRPELEQLKGVLQNPEYHGEGDVYTHTELLCTQMTALPEWEKLEKEEQELLFLAGAFHDIGKSACTKWENGAWTSPKHTIVGEKIFRETVYRAGKEFGLSYQQRELVAKLIRFHGLPVWFWSKKRPEFDLYRAAESIPMKLLYLLSKADVRGRICREPDRLNEHVELFAEYAKELGIWEHGYAFANPYTRYQYFHKDEMSCSAQLFDATKFDVWLLSGLPLSGKDTWIEQNGGERSVISLDAIREEYKIRPTDGSAKVANIAVQRAKELLRKKEPFIWNATNIVEETRQKLCNLFSSYGGRVHIVYIEAPYEELLRRNRKRERDIPVAVLEKMIRGLEIPAPWEGYEIQYLTGGNNNQSK